MTFDMKEEKRYRRHMRTKYTCVVSDVNCCRLLDAVRLVHESPTLIDNSVTICRQHHTAGYCTSIAKIGRKEFELMFDLDLAAIAKWCNWDFEGQLSFGDPPRGVNYA